MDNAVIVHILQAYNDICDEKFGLRLNKFPSPSDVVTQVSTIQIIHDEVKILSVLKSISHIDNKGMVKF